MAKKVVLLNSGGLDSALKAKELYLTKEADEQRSYEIYSLFVEVKGQLGLEASRLAAEETASRYCDHHYTIYVDFGYVPNHYMDANNYFMYDDVEGTYVEDLNVTHQVYDPPSRTNLMTEEEEEVPLWSGPPNLSSVMLSLAISYGMAIEAEEIHSGLHEGQTRFAAEYYKEALSANLSPFNTDKKAEVITNDTFLSKQEALEELSEYEGEFDYTVPSVPPLLDFIDTEG